MSRRWKSELTIDLSRGRCDVLLRPGLLGRDRAVQASAEGEPEIAIAAALADLRRSVGRSLPDRASLTVPDELVYYALIPATRRWRLRNEIATRHFVETLARNDLVVQTSLVASGRAWLSAAVQADDLAAWHRACNDIGVRLEHLHPALLEDLHKIAPGVPSNAILIAVRNEGAMLIRIVRGAITELQWERCDMSDIGHRVAAFGRAVPSLETPCPIIFFHRPGIDADSLRRTAQASGWRNVRGASVSSLEEVEP